MAVIANVLLNWINSSLKKALSVRYLFNLLLEVFRMIINGTLPHLKNSNFSIFRKWRKRMQVWLLQTEKM